MSGRLLKSRSLLLKVDVLLVVDEGFCEGARSLLGLRLVDDHVLAHEVQEATRVWIGMRGRDQSTISSVEPNFEVVLAPLF